MKLGVVVLAAGQGKRMRSRLPKVLHMLAGRPLLAHVLGTAHAIGAARVCVVYGHGGDLVRQTMADYDRAFHDCTWAEQSEQLGTGHAVVQAMEQMQEMDRVLILYGDVPLTQAATLEQLLRTASQSRLGLLTARLADPTGYGRIIRDPGGQVRRIVEQKDADETECEIDEINTGIMIVDRASLTDWLENIGNDNAQGEYYLTDIIPQAVDEGVVIATSRPRAPEEVSGVNDRVQLAALERFYQRLRAEELMRAGVTLADPERLDIRGRLMAGQDVSIDVNVVIEGEVELAEGVSIGPNCLLKDCRIGPDTQVFAHCIIEEAEVGANARIGPFSRLRPGAELADEVHIGNFVEVKKSHIAQGSKVNHLTYVGDARIGSGVNVGAGTITCNYDGANKHPTIIGDDAFIGSNVSLVAPVEIGAGATIGAGSVINRQAPAGELTVTRAKQTTISGWQRPRKKK